MMERSQFSVQLANYNKHHKKTATNSFNYQMPYKIGPVVSSNKTILNTREILHSCDSASIGSTESIYENKSSSLINDRLSSNSAATLNDSRYVTKVDISIDGERNKQFVTTVPIIRDKIDRQNGQVLSVEKEIPTIYIATEDSSKLNNRFPDSALTERDIKLSENVAQYSKAISINDLNDNICPMKSKTTHGNIDHSNSLYHSTLQDSKYKIDITDNNKCVLDTESIKYKFDNDISSCAIVDNSNVLNDDYNTCSCCSEEIYVRHNSNEIGATDLSLKEEVGCLDVVSSSFNYLKESKSSENLSLYSFIADDKNETDIYSGIRDREDIRDLGASISDTIKDRSGDRIELKCSEFQSSYAGDSNSNIDKNDKDEFNEINTGDSTKQYNRNDNLIKENNLKCTLNDDNANKIDWNGMTEGYVFKSTEKCDNPSFHKEIKHNCENQNDNIGLTDSQNSITSDLNGYFQNNRTVDNLKHSEFRPKLTDLVASDIIVSNCVTSENMAGKTAPKSHQPDVISIPERVKLMMNSNSFDCDENWNITKQKKTKKFLTLPPKIHESVLEEDYKENEVEVGKSRLLHVPVSNKVLIPVILKDPSPPQLLKKRKSTVAESNTDLDELKEMAKKLNLSTRRPSYLMWKERLKSNSLSVNQGCINDCNGLDKVNGDYVDNRDSSTSSRMESLTQTLAWLKRELMEMRSQDQVLARTLLQLRQDIREFKLQRSCAEHQEILEDAIDLEEEKDLLGELSCDYIQESFSPTLKNVGVTRMHIGRRRFSVF